MIVYGAVSGCLLGAANICLERYVKRHPTSRLAKDMDDGCNRQLYHYIVPMTSMTVGMFLWFIALCCRPDVKQGDDKGDWWFGVQRSWASAWAIGLGAGHYAQDMVANQWCGTMLFLHHVAAVAHAYSMEAATSWSGLLLSWSGVYEAGSLVLCMGYTGLVSRAIGLWAATVSSLIGIGFGAHAFVVRWWSLGELNAAAWFCATMPTTADGVAAQSRVDPESIRVVGMGWMQAGLIIYAFAAPSALTAVPYAIGMAGFVGGSLICVIVTCASVGAAMMLLRVKLAHPHCHTFGDLGGEVLGPAGRVWGNAIQLGNFFLFLPCALSFCANALRYIGYGIPGITCNDYYVLIIALMCFLTTQVRTLSNTLIFSVVSLVCVIGMASVILVAAFKYDNPAYVPARMLGNPEADAVTRWVKFAGGFTISSWAYVPAFLTVELATCMREPAQFKWSLMLSGALNVLVFLVVGVTVVARWGYNVGEVITITFSVGAWTAGTVTQTSLNAFLVVGNFVSYMLDSVPLGRFCQKAWNPAFADSWSGRDISLYTMYTLPTFLFGLAMAVFVPSITTLLDFTTAFTNPMVTQIYPAVLFWKYARNREVSLLGCQDREILSRWQKIGTAVVFAVGIVNLLVCFTKAVGYLALPSLRPPMAIGCPGWLIWTDK